MHWVGRPDQPASSVRHRVSGAGVMLPDLPLRWPVPYSPFSCVVLLADYDSRRGLVGWNSSPLVWDIVGLGRCAYSLRRFPVPFPANPPSISNQAHASGLPD